METLKPVESSNVHSVGYDPVTQTLAVRFKDKDGKPDDVVYQHKDVPSEHHDALMAADSIGRHYAKNIRGKFDCEPIPA